MLGRAYREIGNTQAALTAFQTIIDHYPTDPLFGDALLEQGRTRFLNNDNGGAIEQYMHVADTYNYLPQAPEALLAGGLPLQLRRRSRSRRARSSSGWPIPIPDTHAGEGRLVPGGVAGLQRQRPRRRRALLRRAFGQDHRRGSGDRLFLGRAAGASARRSEDGGAGVRPSRRSRAGQLFRRARAKTSSAASQPFAPPAQTHFQFDDAAQIAQAEDWMRTTYNITQDGRALAACAGPAERSASGARARIVGRFRIRRSHRRI